MLNHLTFSLGGFKRLARFPLGLLLLLGAAGHSSAEPTLEFDFTNPPGFQSADWTFERDASWTNDGGLSPRTRLRITNANGNQSGAAWYTGRRFDLTGGGWTFQYTGQITYRGNGGADGMGMHLYSGDAAGLLPNFEGAGASEPMLTVAIDTWDNGGGDPSAFHMTILRNNVKIAERNLSYEEDNPFIVTLSYDKAGNTLTAGFAPGGRGAQTLTATNAFTDEQLAALSDVTLGFSANTGGAGENHDVLALRVEEVSIGTTPESPASFSALLGSPSAAQTLELSGNSGEPYAVTAPTGYEVSIDGRTYGSTAVLPQLAEPWIQNSIAASDGAAWSRGNGQQSPNFSAFAAIDNGGAVRTWGKPIDGGDSSFVADLLSSGVVSISSTQKAFAALKADGSVVTWGSGYLGGDSSTVASQLSSDVRAIYSSPHAFAALKTDGSVVAWGPSSWGGDTSYGGDGDVPSKLSSGVATIFSNKYAFAALKNDGSVVTWGQYGVGGAMGSLASAQLSSQVSTIQSTTEAFAALKTDGSVVAWGRAGSGGDASAVSSSLTEVNALNSTASAFAALKDDGSVVTWGDAAYGGDSSAVAAGLASGVTAIHANERAFAALKEDGSVVTWGDAAYAGDSSSVAVELSSGISAIYSNPFAFAAIKENGSVVTWGNPGNGGDSSGVANELSSGVSAVFGNEKAFAALKDDGSVVTWGDAGYGGDSSAVAAQLSSGVTAIYSTAYAFAALKQDGSLVTWGELALGAPSTLATNALTVRIAADASLGPVEGELTISSGGAVKTMPLNGRVIDFSLSESTLTGFLASQGNASQAQSVTISGDTGDTYTVEAPAGYEVSADGESYGGTVVIPATLETGLTVRIAADAPIGTVEGDLVVSSAGVSQTVNLRGTCIGSGSDAFVVDQGTASSARSIGLIGNSWASYTITAPAGFEVSVDGVNYGNSVVLPQMVEPFIQNSLATQDGTMWVRGEGSQFPNYGAFAALNPDGSVFAWGNAQAGGDTSAVASELSSGVGALFSNSIAFAALKEDGSVICWGGADSSAVADELGSGVRRVFSSSKAFAALKEDGSVVTWGDGNHGGDSSAVSAQLGSGVIAIHSNASAFAALKQDGSVVTWGDTAYGADSSAVSAQLSSGVSAIRATERAFAALKEDGSVVAWGDANYGGSPSAVSAQLSSGVIAIHASGGAFAALKDDGAVVTWGIRDRGGDSSAVLAELASGVTAIDSNPYAFVALKSDGSVVTWGSPYYGGDSSAVAESLDDVRAIFSTNGAFAALKWDGSVVTWGLDSQGANSSAVSTLLSSGVATICSNQTSFAALKDDGSVVAWGQSSYGGSLYGVQDLLASGVDSIYSTKLAFTALKEDGSIVTWGADDRGMLITNAPDALKNFSLTVRLAAGAAIGRVEGDLTVVSSDGVTQLLGLAGSVLGFDTEVSTLDGFTAVPGTASDPQVVGLTGYTGDSFTVLAPLGYEVAIDGSNYGSTVEMPATLEGSLTVRLAADAPAGAVHGDLTITSANFSQTVALSGSMVTRLASRSFDFSSTPGYQSTDWELSEVAEWVQGSELIPGSRLRLTDAQWVLQTGAAWYRGRRFNLGFGDWSFQYTGQITERGNGGADGMGMHLYAGEVDGFVPDFEGRGSSDALLTVAIDTWDNGTHSSYGDTSAFHMTILYNNVRIGQVDLLTENDEPFFVALDYEKDSNTLVATFTPTGGESQTITITDAFDRWQLQALSDVALGFSANGGYGHENHDVLDATVDIEPRAVSSASIGGFTAVEGNPSKPEEIVLNSDTDDGYLLNAPSGYELSIDGSNYSSTLVISDIPSAPVSVRLSAGMPLGPVEGNLSIVSGNVTQIVELIGEVVPFLDLSASNLTDFLAVGGVNSDAQSIELAGTTGGLCTITAPAGFEVSLDGLHYSQALSIPLPEEPLIQNSLAAQDGAVWRRGSSEQFANDTAFAAIRWGGAAVAWGNPDAGGDAGTVTGWITSQLDLSSFDSMLNSGVEAIYSDSGSFAALKSDGSVVVWGRNASQQRSELRSGVSKVYSTPQAFAALKSDGSVYTWGHSQYGGLSSDVADRLSSGVTTICAAERAFAALKEDGSVVTWGYGWWTDSSSVATELSAGVVSLHSSSRAFAAVKSDGSVVTWGDSAYGGDSSGVAGRISSGVSTIFSNPSAFVALKDDGSVVTWGDSRWGGDSSIVADELGSGVVAVYSCGYGFAALKTDGSVVSWGGYGQRASSQFGVPERLTEGVVSVSSNERAYAALKEDGSVVTWGEPGFGNDSSSVKHALRSGVASVHATERAFAALKEDGSVVTWGAAGYGGDSSAVAGRLDSDVISIYSTRGAFSALKADGSVVAWGDGAQIQGVPATLKSFVLHTRLAGNALPGEYEQDLVITSGGMSQTVRLNGTSLNFSTSQARLEGFSSSLGEASEAMSLDLAGYTLDSYAVEVSSGFEVSTDQVNYSSSMVVPEGASATLYVRLSENLPVGNLEGQLAITSGGVTRVVELNGEVLDFEASVAALDAFAAPFGSVSAVQSFELGGYTGEPFILSAPAGFELSVDGQTYARTLELATLDAPILNSLAIRDGSVWARGNGGQFPLGLAFIALNRDGSVISWGGEGLGGDSSPVSERLSSGVREVCQSLSAVAALMDDGSVVSWGHSEVGGDSSSVASQLASGVSSLHATGESFAALKTDGSVVTWGRSYNGGDPGSVASYLSSGVTSIYSNRFNFLAIKEDGGLVTWGLKGTGVLSSDIEAEYGSGILKVYHNASAFALLLEDGSVVTFGDSRNGGDSSAVAAQLASGVREICGTSGAFAALTEEGSVVTWGEADWGGDSSAVSDRLAAGVSEIYSTTRSFAARMSDGSVVTWGQYIDSSALPAGLDSGVVRIFSNDGAFAALKEDGSVVTWGYPGYGGDSSSVASELLYGVQTIFATESAFAALKDDGSVITWGFSVFGGDSSSVSSQLASGVGQVFSVSQAFAAVKLDGSLVIWGNSQAATGAPSSLPLSTSVSVRLAADAPLGSVGGDLTITSGGISKSVPFEGVVTDFNPEVSQLDGFAARMGNSSPAQSLRFTGSTGQGFTVTAPSGYEVSIDGVNYSSTMEIPLDFDGSLTVRLSPNLQVGAYEGDLVIVSAGITRTVALSGAVSSRPVQTQFDFTAAADDYQSEDWLLLGDAVWADDPALSPGERLRLNPARQNQLGTAWYLGRRFDLGFSNWKFQFTGQISARDAIGADGIGMHFYSGNIDGYLTEFETTSAAVPNLTVALDTYDNGGEDPGAFHLTVWSNGQKIGEKNLSNENDQPFTISLEYDPSANALVAVYLPEGGLAQTLTIANAFTLEQLAALSDVALGFSANAGASIENHDVLGFGVDMTWIDPGSTAFQAFSAPIGSSSEPQGFRVRSATGEGYVVTAPEGYEVSIDGISFGSDLIVPVSFEGEVLVRLGADASAGLKEGSLAITSAGITETLALTGSVIDFNPDVASLEGFSTAASSASAAQVINVIGNTGEAYYLTAPAGFELSENGSDYGVSLLVAFSSEPVPISVRLASGASAGVIEGDLSITSAGITRTVTLRGTVIDFNADVTSLSGFFTATGAPSEARVLTVSGNTGDAFTVTAPDGYEITTAGAAYSASLSIPFTPEPFSISVRLAADALVGEVEGVLTISSAGITKTVALSGIVNLVSKDSWLEENYGLVDDNGDPIDISAPDVDGVSRLVKYALSIPVGSRGVASLPQPGFTEVGGEPFLAMTLTRDPARSDVSIYVEASYAPGDWTVVASSVNGRPFTGEGIVSEADTAQGKKQCVVRDTVTGADGRFMRVRVEVR